MSNLISSIGLLVFALTVTACAQQRRPSHADLMRQLQAEATKREVYYRVWCTSYYEGDKEQYQGIATKGSDLNIYAEDGAEAYWQVYFYKTADEAAYALLQALKRPPNARPQYRDRDKKRAECPMPISGRP